MTEYEDTLLEFPCRFTVKVMGRNEEEFVTHVLHLVGPHFPELRNNDVRTRLSRGGKYIAVTITITAASKPQLDAIYYALTDSDRVLMAL